MSEENEFYWDSKEMTESESNGKKLIKAIRIWDTFKGNQAMLPLNATGQDIFERRPDYYLKPDSPFYGFVDKQRGIFVWTGKIEYMERKLNHPSKFKPSQTECFYTCWMNDLFNPAISASFRTIMFEKMRDFKDHNFILQTNCWDQFVTFSEDHDVPTNVEVRNINLSMRPLWKTKRI